MNTFCILMNHNINLMYKNMCIYQSTTNNDNFILRNKEIYCYTIVLHHVLTVSIFVNNITMKMTNAEAEEKSTKQHIWFAMTYVVRG